MSLTDVASNPDVLIWEFNFALSTFYEVETEGLEALLPKRLTPMEVAPGVALLNVTAFNFVGSSLGTLPEFQELILSAIVAPDLRRGVPKFAMFVLSLASNNQDHLDHSADFYKLPIFGLLSQVDINRAAFEVSYADAHGPIITGRNLHPSPVYEPGERYFQSFVEEDGEIYVSDLLLKADLFEHQQAGDPGLLSPHPFFRDLNLDGGKPLPYLQMLSKPGTLGRQFYPKPERFV